MQIKKPLGIGGQAVMEGVMMKKESIYAIAVRRADQSIDIKKEEYHDILGNSVFSKIPLLRGIINFIEILYLGLKTFLYSASFYGEEEIKRKQEWEEWISTGTGRNFTKDKKKNRTIGRLAKIKSVLNKIKIIFFMLCFLVIAAAFIFLLPMVLSEKLIGLELSMEKAMIEEGMRILLFFLSFLLMSKIEDIRRIFMYHGAENKVMNCIENGLELTVENVRKQLRQHKNCRTSFFFCVLFFSILSFALIQTETLWKKIVFQIVCTLLIAAVCYEWMYLTERTENILIEILSKPGLLFQKLFTKEPEDDMIFVAMESLEAVFDWRVFLQEHEGNHIEWKPLNEKQEQREQKKQRKDSEIESKAMQEEKIKEDRKEETEGTEKTFSMLAKERLQPDIENEDDPILKALDKFFGE